jgi:hypothetical protein
MRREYTSMSQDSRCCSAEGSICPVILESLEGTIKRANIEEGDISAPWGSTVSDDFAESSAHSHHHQKDVESRVAPDPSVRHQSRACVLRGRWS